MALLARIKESFKWKGSGDKGQKGEAAGEEMKKEDTNVVKGENNAGDSYKPKRLLTSQVIFDRHSYYIILPFADSDRTILAFTYVKHVLLKINTCT